MYEPGAISVPPSFAPNVSGSAEMMPTIVQETALGIVFSTEPVLIEGRYLLADGQEHACRTRYLGLDEAEIIAPVSGRVGERVIVYLDEIGALTGVIAAVLPKGFLMTIEVTPERRTRLAARLDWLTAQASGHVDRRGDLRIVPTRTDVVVRLPGGDVVPGTVVDLSMTGAAITAAVHPALGEVVTVGKRRATVVRHFEDGFAVTFLLPLRPETFGPHTVL